MIGSHEKTKNKCYWVRYCETLQKEFEKKNGLNFRINILNIFLKKLLTYFRQRFVLNFVDTVEAKFINFQRRTLA